jgi:hypothetical protein
MNLDNLKDFFKGLNKHDLPTGVAALAGIVLLFLIFKSGKFFMKLVFLLIAAALFAAAYWWHTHK